MQPAWADPRDDARRNFLQGLRHAESGDYESALSSFLAAEGQYSHPATMYNIARAYEDLGQPDEAVAWYDRLIAEHPDRAGDAQQRVAALRPQVAPAPVAQGQPGTVGTVVSSTGATPEELERLQALARQLDALTTELLERPPPGPVVVAAPAEEASDTDTEGADVPADPNTPPTVDAPPPAPPDAGTFLTDAYERTITSATRSGQDPLDAPMSVTVITADEIRLSGATTFADVLRRVPGMEVMSMASPTPYVGIRGFNSELTNKVLWLVDGRPVYFEMLAAPLPLGFPIGLEDVERIEVVRGPGSALYGANAVTGVINILTRQPDDTHRAMAVFRAGSPDFLYAAGNASGTEGILGYRFSAGYEQEGRWTREGEFTEDDPVEPFFDEQSLAGRKFRGSGLLQMRFLDQGLASVEGGFSRGRTELYNIGALGNYALEGTTSYLRGDLTYGPVHLRTFWNREAGDLGPWISDAGRSRDLNASVINDGVDLEVEANIPVKSGPVDHLINLGAGYKYKNFQFDYLSGGKDTPWIEHHARAFIQEQLSWKWLTVVASFRVDRHPLVDVSKTLSPRGALVFRVAPRTSLRINGGTAFRAMNSVESYMDIAIDTTADGYFVRDFGGEIERPNDTADHRLEPERIVSVEIGAHDESSPFHRVDVALYWNRVSKLIGLEPVSQVLLPYDPDRGGIPFGVSGWANLDEIYDAFGGEADVTVFPVDGLDVFANVALQRILERVPGESSVTDGATSFAKVNVGVTYRAPFRMDFSVRGHWYSQQTWRLREFGPTGDIVLNERDVPSRFVMSARIAGRPLPDRDLEFGLSLWNPLGFSETARFREHPKGQLVGGRVVGHVSFAF